LGSSIIEVTVKTHPEPRDTPHFHLFISPHLDDAVLSCGGQISMLASAGNSVAIFTLMAGKPMRELPTSPILSELHARWGTAANPVAERRWEDIKATRRLGALARHGTIPDCVYRVRYSAGGEREALYPFEESLWGPISPDDPAILLLEATPLIYPQADVLHVPLGAGGHVDHRLVRDWGRRLARTSGQIEVSYYEEYPYTREEGAIERALADFAPATLEPVLRPLGEDALQAKIEAIACYESQLSTFWPDRAAMAADIRAVAVETGAGQAAEREWRVSA
jgi:LmbE family N-acetylglucosaminyl deacetylase